MIQYSPDTAPASVLFYGAISIEHTFRAINRLSGYTNVHTHQLAKNATQIVMPLFLSNPWMAGEGEMLAPASSWHD